MPPRLVTFAIVLFWLITTSTLVYRELEPRFRTGEPPPFTIPLTADIGKSIVNWKVLQKDILVGQGFTQIERHPDRTYEFYAQFKMDKFKAFADLLDLKVVSSYRTTEDGRLVSGSAHLKCFTDLLVGKSKIEFDFQGDVKDRHFHPEGTLDLGPLHFSLPLKPFAVSDSGNILNPMHLVHKISGLREGRSWPIPLMDPTKAIEESVANALPTGGLLIKELIATVSLDDLDWNEHREPCYKISYAKHGERPLAATWVRRRDDAVLQQWAGYEGVEYTLQRLGDN